MLWLGKTKIVRILNVQCLNWISYGVLDRKYCLNNFINFFFLVCPREITDLPFWFICLVFIYIKLVLISRVFAWMNIFKTVLIDNLKEMSRHRLIKVYPTIKLWMKCKTSHRKGTINCVSISHNFFILLLLFEGISSCGALIPCGEAALRERSVLKQWT